MLVIGRRRVFYVVLAFEDIPFLFRSHLLKFLRRVPVALVLGCSRNLNVIVV